jgi:hypothetical protein
MFRAEPADVEITHPRGHNIAAVNSSKVFVRIDVLLDTSVPHPAMDGSDRQGGMEPRHDDVRGRFRGRRGISSAVRSLESWPRLDKVLITLVEVWEEGEMVEKEGANRLPSRRWRPDESWAGATVKRE